MIGALMDQRLTVVRREVGEPDRFGQPTRGAETRTTHTGRLQPRSSTEQGREYVSGQWVAYLPASADVRASDELEHEGRTFQVDGTPERRSVPGRPSLTHVRVYLLEREET